MRPPILAKNILPSGWRDFLVPGGRCALGVDPATTTKAKSNPTGLALTQQVGADFIVRLALRFKSSDPDVLEYLLRELCQLPHGLRMRKVVMDATNERFFAATMRKKLAGTVVVEPIVSSETLEYKGEKMTFKTYLGNLLVNTMEDGHLLLPRAEWLRDDLRSVKRDRGGFTADVDADGNHADVFDGIKNSLYGLIGASNGPAVSVQAPVGTFNQGGGDRPGVRGPLARIVAAVKRMI